MSAMVDSWGSDLAKVKEDRASREMFFPKVRAEQANAKMKEVKEKSRAGAFNRENSMSESTLCLLMDRFAPS